MSNTAFCKIERSPFNTNTDKKNENLPYDEEVLYEAHKREIAIKKGSAFDVKKLFSTKTDYKNERLPSISQLPLSSKDVTIEQIVPRIRLIISDRAADRILKLNQAALEGDLEGVLLSAKSLLKFLEFMRHNSDLPEPSIVLSNSGNVVARWTEHSNKLLTVEFLSNGLVNFVLFSPFTDSEVERFGGITSHKNLNNTIKEYGISEWGSLWKVKKSLHRIV